MEYIIFAAAVFGTILLLMLKGYADDRKAQKKFVEKLYNEYGTLQKREYKPEQFVGISRYFEKHKTGFFIDDITWSDLNMDEVFKRMNHTLSSAGEEYLYYTLRTPCFDRKELQQREEAIEYFRTHEDERVSCQLLFARLGRMGKFSIYDYLDYLGDLGKRKNTRHYAAMLSVLFGVLFLFFNLPVGILLLVVIFVANIISYFKVKEQIEPYITSFSYIFRLIHIADGLHRIKLPVLTEETEQLKRAVAGMSSFKRGSGILMSSGRMSGSGNILDIFLDYLRMVFHLDLLKFNQMLFQVNAHIEDIDRMLTIAGRMEMLIAVGAFREGNRESCVPEFMEETEIHAENMYHPLIKNPIKNKLTAKRSILITGSNASGKSTFLKTVAVNAILAQTIHTCMADRYETGMFRVCSSMALRDDIEGGDSYYMVEIKALKRILDALSAEGAPVLCFVDEVLRGTNTVERIAASTQILSSMGKSRCLCFAATHDIELTQLLEQQYDNYHFEEEIADNDIFFSYKIMEGKAATRNAIKLLGIMGYDSTIIEKAERLAQDFILKGSWT